MDIALLIFSILTFLYAASAADSAKKIRKDSQECIESSKLSIMECQSTTNLCMEVLKNNARQQQGPQEY